MNTSYNHTGRSVYNNRCVVLHCSIHTYLYAYTHTYTHTHVHTPTHTHTRPCESEYNLIAARPPPHRLTDCNITMKTSPSAASKETPPPAEVVPADGPPVVVVELVKFNVPSIRNTNRSCDPSNGAAGKGNEFIIPDPMASCPTENIDWNSITLVVAVVTSPL